MLAVLLAPTSFYLSFKLLSSPLDADWPATLLFAGNVLRVTRLVSQWGENGSGTCLAWINPGTELKYFVWFVSLTARVLHCFSNTSRRESLPSLVSACPELKMDYILPPECKVAFVYLAFSSC